MFNADDLDPPQSSLKPVEFETMSVEELKGYIASLNAEISRAEAMIAKKQNHKSGVEFLFKTPGKAD